jgi:hypothetical protein
MPELHTFETLAEDNAGTVDRLSVAGGWLYRTRTWDNRSNTFATSLAFVPDAAATGEPAPPASAPGTCFWYANLAAADLTADGEFHALAIGEGYPFGNTALVAAAEDGFSLTRQCVVMVDCWIEFAAPPASGGQVGIECDDAGVLQTRGQVQLLPGAQSIAHTSYNGIMQAGQIVRPAALIAAGDAVSVLGTSYITAHVIPLE